MEDSCVLGLSEGWVLCLIKQSSWRGTYFSTGTPFPYFTFTLLSFPNRLNFAHFKGIY